METASRRLEAPSPPSDAFRFFLIFELNNNTASRQEIIHMWEAMSPEDRQRYEDFALEDRQRYEREMAAFTNQFQDKILVTEPSTYNCPICLVPLNQPDDLGLSQRVNIVRLKNCATDAAGNALHKFHKECIINWATNNNIVDEDRNPVIRCPVCRTLSFGKEKSKRRRRSRKRSRKRSKRSKRSQKRRRRSKRNSYLAL